jgi:hypothetical protein
MTSFTNCSGLIIASNYPISKGGREGVEKQVIN